MFSRIVYLVFVFQMSEEEASQLAKKMINAEFDFNDFLKQSQMMKGMGSLGGVANMIPGMAGKLTPEQINKVEVCMPTRRCIDIYMNNMTGLLMCCDCLLILKVC